jgi:pimeloyl-ACP methyl ester carboxylesterase
MTHSTVPWTNRILDLHIGGVDVHVAALVAPSSAGTPAAPAAGEPVVFLHGFGSTKEEYADFTTFPGLAGRAFVAYDAPGFAASTATDLKQVSIPFLVSVALAVLDELGIDQFHVVGHSMGGLTALMLAHQAADRVLSFTDIEGNVAPEDCFLSRQIVTHGDDDPTKFLTAFAARTLQSVEYSSALYGSRVLTTVNPHVVRPVFESMVDLSDNGDLLAKLTGLPMPRMFMHGEQNSHLTYLPALREHGVRVESVEHSGHWPMYSNPPAMWAALSDFLAAVDSSQR